jgi:hypothetical protein
MTGKIQQTGKDLTIGHKDRATNSYFLRGTIDEVKIFNDELPVSEIKILPTLWNPYTGIHAMNSGSVNLFPNPSDGFVYLKLNNNGEVPLRIEAFDTGGHRLEISMAAFDNSTIGINMVNPVHGVVMIRIHFRDTVKQAKVIFR